jgi:DNA replicative helicase MCM subunit Mcm2 (Cdc46/Mcm family)
MQDQHLAQFVVASHIKHHPNRGNHQYEMPVDPALGDVQPIPQELLKKYIVYARENVHPKLQRMDQDKVAKMYSQLRQESLVSSINICVSTCISLEPLIHTTADVTTYFSILLIQFCSLFYMF